MKKPDPRMDETYYGKRNPKEMLANKRAVRRVETGLTKKSPMGDKERGTLLKNWTTGKGGAEAPSKSKNIMPMPRKIQKQDPRDATMPMPRKMDKKAPKSFQMPSKRY